MLLCRLTNNYWPSKGSCCLHSLPSRMKQQALLQNNIMCLPTNNMSYIRTDKSSCSPLFDALKSLPTSVIFILLVLILLLMKIKSHLLLDFPHTILLRDRNLTPAVTLLTSIPKVPSLNLSQDTFYPDWVSIRSSSAYLSKCQVRHHVFHIPSN
jgi:hypothetical protein